MNHQSNQLVAMRWLIAPLDVAFDELHRQARDSEVDLMVQIASFHDTHRIISGVLHMARLPRFALLGRVISDIAADVGLHHDDVVTLYFASRLLHHELQQFVKTGLLRQELVIERVSYLLERYLPYDYLHTQILVPYQDIDLSKAATWYHHIQIDECKLIDVASVDNLAGAWIETLQKLKEALGYIPVTTNQSNGDESADPQLSALTNLQTLIELARMSTAQKSGYQQILWYLIILWLEDVAYVADRFGSVKLDGFDLLLLDRVLHGDFDNKSLASDIYVILSSQIDHRTTSKELLEQLSITAVRQPFFMQVLQSLSRAKSAHQAKRLPIAMLDEISQKLANRGWINHAQTVTILNENYSVMDDGFGDKINVIYDDIAELYSTLSDDFLMLKIQTALNDIKSAFAEYLHSKNVIDLPTDDSFDQLHHGVRQIGLTSVVQAVDELHAVFDRLGELKLDRISWQLAHSVADALVLFEEFFDALNNEQYHSRALEDSMRHAKLAHRLTQLQDAQSVEIHDIYNMLLKTHESVILYDDVGQHQPIEGELITTENKLHSTSETHDVEEAVIQEEIINNEHSAIMPRPDFSTKSDPAFMNEQGEQVRLTDILELPTLPLEGESVGMQQMSTLDVSRQTSQECELDLEELGESLRPKSVAPLVAYQAMIEQMDIESEFHQMADDESEDQQKTYIKDQNDGQDIVATENSQDSLTDKHVDEQSDSHDIDQVAIKVANTNNQDNQSADVLSQRYIMIRDGMAMDDFSYDDELREIFIEEADEVLSEIATYLPLWQQDIHDKAMIKALCRNFHTLKGSGRMVGAHQVGDTAWAIENLLNRAYEDGVSISTQMYDLVAHTTTLIPSMVSDFARGQQPHADGASVILQVDNLLSGNDMYLDVPNLNPQAQESSPSTMQVDMIEIESTQKSQSPQGLVAEDTAINDEYQADSTKDEIDDEMPDGIYHINTKQNSEQVDVADVALAQTDDEVEIVTDGVIAKDDHEPAFIDDVDTDTADTQDEMADDITLATEVVSTIEFNNDNSEGEVHSQEAIQQHKKDIRVEAKMDLSDEVLVGDDIIGLDDALDISGEVNDASLMTDVNEDVGDDSVVAELVEKKDITPKVNNEQIQEDVAELDIAKLFDTQDDEIQASKDVQIASEVQAIQAEIDDASMDELSDEILAFDDVVHTFKVSSDDDYVADYSLADELIEQQLITEDIDDDVSLSETLDEYADKIISDDLVGDVDDEAVIKEQDTLKTQIDWHSDTILDGLALPKVLNPFVQAAQQPLESVVQDVDDDIREIYIEEAGEVLAQIKPLFSDYKNNQDRTLLIDIRRGFHTLKGSGRMVGAVELGELAWSIENMLNRVLDDTISMSTGMMVLIADVLDEFDDLVMRFETHDTYPDKLILWRACGDAYSKGHADSFDYASLSQSKNTHQDTPVAQTQMEMASEVDKEILDHPQSLEALNFIQEAGSIISSATLDAPQGEEEEMICGIFVEEARELIDEVRDFLAKNEQKDSVFVSDKVVRAFHTLRGALGIEPLSAIGKVGEVVERGLQSLQQHDAPMTSAHLLALSEAVGHIEAHLDAYENPDQRTTTEDVILTGFDDVDDEASVHLLIEGVDGLLDAEFELPEIVEAPTDDIVAYAASQLTQIDILASRTRDIPKFPEVLDTLRQAYTLILHEPEVLADDEFVQTLLRAHDELIGLFDSLAGSMSLSVDSQVLSTMAGFTTRYQKLLTAPDVDEVDIPAPTPEKTMTFTRDIDDMDNINRLLVINRMVEEATTDDEPVHLEVVETEDELLQIFLAEAHQVDELMQADMQAWHKDITDKTAISSLQRHLHTIKGGARLAGIVSVGNLTHATESVYQAMLSGEIRVHEDWLSTMQKVQDTISLQLQHIAEDKSSIYADGMIEDLQDYVAVGDVMGEIRIPKMPKKTISSKEMADEANSTTETAKEQDKDLTLEIAPTRPTLPFKDYIAQSWQGSVPDKDILEVFLEEAKDLAESSSEDFGVFRNNTGDIETLQSLQRKLHTIKGGARMVSANGMADLAHEMETVYENLGESRSPATKQVTDLLFACHDWISASVPILYKQYNPPRPTPLIEALQTYIHNPDSLGDTPSVSLAEISDTLAAYENMSDDEGGRNTTKMPPMKGVFGETAEKSVSSEMIRISAPMIERMINLSGEAAINRARIDMNMTSLSGSIEEMGITVQRLADQLRRMDIELEAQILSQIDDADMFVAGFDPLEMDQYSSLNQLSKSLSESASDLLDIKATLVEKTRDSENLLLQLSRTQTELQDSLMSSRMVPFSRITPRLQRIVRQTAGELGKNVELSVVNADDEMDRSILERITSPLEHMLRNAVDHGIEYPDRRSEAGKSAIGHITLEIVREGGEVVIMLSDDGSGINVDAVRKKAISQGLIQPDDDLSDSDIMQYIFNSGLSTTNKITQISGRGVGMDVVRTEIRELGGSVLVQSQAGRGSRFIIRLPLTVAVSDALIVRVADQQYAIPLVQIERVVQVDAASLLHYHQSGATNLQILEKDYRLRYLNEILTGSYFSEIVAGTSLPVIIIKSQVGQALALQVDEIIGSRTEVVVKPLGRQLSHLSGISAATIMGDGSVMLILDLLALMRTPQIRSAKDVSTVQVIERKLIMVVDDSVTVRKVTSRFLERQGFDVVVAKDGIDAIEILQETLPDIMLLDIEMPRMDGFEVATQVRNSPRLKDLPIIMITSRTGEKHRERAFDIGVNDYMGKPFQENELLEHIWHLLKTNSAAI